LTASIITLLLQQKFCTLLLEILKKIVEITEMASNSRKTRWLLRLHAHTTSRQWPQPHSRPKNRHWWSILDCYKSNSHVSRFTSPSACNAHHQLLNRYAPHCSRNLCNLWNTTIRQHHTIASKIVFATYLLISQNTYVLNISF